MDIFSLYWVIIETLAAILRIKKKLRNFILVFGFILMVSILGILIYFKGELTEIVIIISITLIFLLLLFILSAIMALFKEPISLRNPFELELKRLTEERIELKKKVEETVEKGESDSVESVFNIIQLNLNQTTEYYTINKGQARKSFGISVTAIVIGSLTILVGIYLVYFGDGQKISVISIISGVVLEIIGGMYFVIYNKSIKQLNYFYNKLEKVQDTMLAIELTNGIEDKDKSLELKEKIILKLIERSSIN